MGKVPFDLANRSFTFGNDVDKSFEDEERMSTISLSKSRIDKFDDSLLLLVGTCADPGDDGWSEPPIF